MTYHFSCIKDEKGFWGECLELPGCVTQGSTKAQFKENCQEALDLYLEDSNVINNDTNNIMEGIIEITPSAA